MGAQVDEQVEDKRRQTRHQQQQLDQLKETVQQSRPGHERNVKEVAKLRNEIASTERATQDIMNKANVLKVQMQEKEEQKDRAQRQARSSSSEVEMLKKEKSRLEELVVTDPGEWESAFEARQADIEQTKRTIGHLKMERIPQLDENVKQAKHFEKEITKVNERMEELKLKRAEQGRILGDLSNVEGQIQDRSGRIQEMKREAD